MRRSLLYRNLSAYRAHHPQERATVERMLAFAQQHPDCFERTLTVGHFTGSAWLVDAAGERVLLTHHRKLDRWLQLGGHADGESDLLQVALREAEEESGLSGIEVLSAAIYDLDIHAIPARGDDRAHHHYDVRFALRAAGDECFQVSRESKALAWVPIASVADKTDDQSLLRMVAKWQAMRSKALPVTPS